MTLSLTHAFTSAKSDGPDATLIRATNWNAEHTLTMATGKILGRTTAGTGAVEELDSTDMGLETGTLALFQQTAAPTGWTKETTHNDKAFRVVTGTASSGGTNAFSAQFALLASEDYTLLEADIPSHTHTINITDPGHTHTSKRNNASVNLLHGGSQPRGENSDTTGSSTTGITAAAVATGDDGAHAHNMDLRTAYVDIIIAAKD